MESDNFPLETDPKQRSPAENATCAGGKGGCLPLFTMLSRNP